MKFRRKFVTAIGVRVLESRETLNIESLYIKHGYYRAVKVKLGITNYDIH